MAAAVVSTRPPAQFKAYGAESNSVPLPVVLLAVIAGAGILHLALPIVDVAGAVTLGVVQLFAVLVAAVDHREQRIPNVHVAWMLVAVLAAAAAVGTTLGDVWPAALAGLGVGVGLTLLAGFTGGVGMGDAKFLAVATIALWMVSPYTVAAVLVISCSGLVAQALLTGASRVPMGPWIAVSLAPALLVSSALS